MGRRHPVTGDLETRAREGGTVPPLLWDLKDPVTYSLRLGVGLRLDLTDFYEKRFQFSD